MSDPAGELSKAFELLHLRDLRQRLFALARSGLDSLFQVRICRRKLSRAGFNSPLQLLVERFELPGLPVEVAENANLRAQEVRNDRDRKIVDSAGLIASQAVELGEVNRGDEDDRGLFKPRMFANHRGQLKSVQLGHRDVDKDDRDFVPQKLLKRLSSGRTP